MILDEKTLLSDQQAITVSAASTNVIDLGVDDGLVIQPNEKGAFSELFFQVTEAFVGGTSLKVSVVNEADATITDASEAEVETLDILTAQLVPGFVFAVRMPRVLSKRFLAAFYTVVGTFTAGKITGGIIIDVQTNGR